MYTYNCELIRVVDGDTIDVFLDLGFNIRIKERVRLLGVNTPEVFGLKAKTELAEGIKASEFTKQWVDERQKKPGQFIFTSKVYDARDKYGRSLGILSWVSKPIQPTTAIIPEELNHALVEMGWGVIHK